MQNIQDKYISLCKELMHSLMDIDSSCTDTFNPLASNFKLYYKQAQITLIPSKNYHKIQMIIHKEIEKEVIHNEYKFYYFGEIQEWLSHNLMPVALNKENFQELLIADGVLSIFDLYKTTFDKYTNNIYKLYEDIRIWAKNTRQIKTIKNIYDKLILIGPGLKMILIPNKSKCTINIKTNGRWNNLSIVNDEFSIIFKGNRWVVELLGKFSGIEEYEINSDTMDNVMYLICGWNSLQRIED